MDWKYKHFDQEAIFNAPVGSVLEAAKAVAAETYGKIEDTTDGFTAQGYSGWNNVIANFHVMSAAEGTRLSVELLAERSSLRGYMLFDIGGFYNAQINKWFSSITQRLGGAQEDVLVSKTTSDLWVQRGCLTGCFVYLIVGICLGILAIPLDRLLFPQTLDSSWGPFSTLGSFIGFLAGIGAFLYVLYPDAPASKSFREWLGRIRNK
ncbi:MAG TPA: hypothetical protein VHM28_02165 [Anaerolineales bacterium]|nr:hypothetical protein [Anaerolineales bacterium]